MTTKQVIVIRKDLNMRKGKIASQAAHASMGVFTKDATPKQTMQLMQLPEAQEWFENSFTKICVGVDSEQQLLDIYQQAKDSDMLCCLIQDNGTTEFSGVKTYTAVAIGPGYNEDVDKITGGLKLL